MAQESPTPPILVVEDSAEIRQSLEWLLRVDGFAVVTAVHGADALRKLQAGLRPCLILLDLQMPEMDGFEFRKLQLQAPQLAHIPVVVYADTKDPEAVTKQLQAAAFVRKPLDLDTLLAVVEKYCKKSLTSSPSRFKRAS